MSYRLLVIDDNPNYRVLVRYALAGSNVEVVGEATDADEGIEAAARLAPDVILIDLVMESMDGLAALKPLREAAPDATIVTVSSYAEHELWGLSAHLMNVAYVSKSLPPSLLADVLVGAVKSKRASTAELVASERQQFPPDLQSAREARRFVVTTLRAWACEPLVDSVSLLVSELVTNAVIHAHSAVELVLHLSPDKVRVEVIDAANMGVHRRDAASDAQSGRGMALIEALASSWGIDSLLSGKSVWFEVSRPVQKAS